MKPHDWTARIPDPVIELIRRLDENGFETWLVGGCVRDMSLGIMPDDYDAATNARPDQVCQLFDRCLETGIRHGTVTVLLPGMSVEVTTFRSEGPYSDGRRPDHIRFEQGILPDLSRRDFTINSMAWHPYRGLIDPFGGMADLNQLQLRCVGSSLERMQEDALRQLRAVRFSLTYDLKPDNELIEAIKQSYHRVRNLSSERLSHELNRLMISSYSHNLEYFADTPLLRTIAEKLLGFFVDSKIFSTNLACFIQPFWHREQIWPAFYLACVVTDSGIIPQVIAASQFRYYSPENWLLIRTKLTATALSDFIHTLVSNVKISKEQARRAEAILILIGLRLIMYNSSLRKSKSAVENGKSDVCIKNDIKKEYCPLSLRQMKIMIRSCMRRTRLSPELLFDCLISAIDLMHALQADPSFGEMLEQDRILASRSKNQNYLLSIHDLDIKGDNRLFSGLSRPSLTGLYLERLLSLVIHNSPGCSAQEMELILAGWLDQKKSGN